MLCFIVIKPYFLFYESISKFKVVIHLSTLGLPAVVFSQYDRAKTRRPFIDAVGALSYCEGTSVLLCSCESHSIEN